MEHITNLIDDLGIRTSYTGYQYLHYALHLCCEDENNILFVWKWLYGGIAKQYGKNRSSVEHALRTVVASCWCKGNRELLNSIAGYQLDGKPTVGEFITLLHRYIKTS